VCHRAILYAAVSRFQQDSCAVCTIVEML
jgi:hypothetical protein